MYICLATLTGVYSDATKFPYSGGYVWISECCSTRFVSVFNGSIFEGAPHPPSCILKLIYHWSCQTNIQNVVQWVKVDNVYIKGVYTWLRAVCTLAVHQKCKKLGGEGKYVEVSLCLLNEIIVESIWIWQTPIWTLQYHDNNSSKTAKLSMIILLLFRQNLVGF